MATNVKTLKQKADEDALKKYIIDRLDDASEAPRFLKAGLSNDLSLGKFFTPEVFTEYFLVKHDDNYENREINNLIHSLVRSDRYNLLCLEAGRGCGKSTFVNTCFRVKDPKNRYEFEYPYPYIDLNRRSIPYKYCEDVILNLFEKQYEALIVNRTWFEHFCEFIQTVRLPDDYNAYFKDIAAKCKDGQINAIRDGHATRCAVLPDCDIKIYLLLYLAALAEKPQNKVKTGDGEELIDTRWVIIFDGIEVYVTRDAENAAETIVDIHNFLSNAFDSVNKRPVFFTRFTFVIPIRTATCLSFMTSFGNQGTELFGYNYDYIFSLPVYNFSLQALLKKMYFLANKLGKEYEEVSQTPLFVACMDVVSSLIPKPIIEQYLKDAVSIEVAVEKLRYFAEQRLLPLLNYDYRSAIDKLIQLSRPENHEDFIGLQRIETEIQSNNKVSIEYAANGKNMIITRTIFNIFRRLNLLDEIGYTAFDPDHQPGIARTMFNFLYYKEMSFRYINRHQANMGREYNGISFRELLDRLEPFARDDIARLADIIYKVSALNSGTTFSRVWTHLIVLKNLDERMTAYDFRNKISDYYSLDKNTEYYRKLSRDMGRWLVKLSDAGMCFNSWGSRQFEFLLARNTELSSNALFTYNAYSQIDGVRDACLSVYKIIKNEAVGKLVQNCLDGCSYCSGKKDTAFALCRFDKDLLECSLFQRYQECLFFIIDSIDYIDRYRIFTIQSAKVQAVSTEDIYNINKQLLEILFSFWTLFDDLKAAIEKGMFSEHSDTFFIKLSRVQNTYSRITINSDKRSIRVPYSDLWNMATMEQRVSVIKSAIEYPSEQELYDILKEQLIKDKLVFELKWKEHRAVYAANELTKIQFQDVKNAVARWIRYNDCLLVSEKELDTVMLTNTYHMQYPSALLLLYYYRTRPSVDYSTIMEMITRMEP